VRKKGDDRRGRCVSESERERVSECERAARARDAGERGCRSERTGGSRVAGPSHGGRGEAAQDEVFVFLFKKCE
jgi:hypothetical protein